MTNTELLKEKIKQSGYKLCFIAQRCGLTYPAFLSRLKGEQEFRTDEMRAISELLALSDADNIAIFFAHDVDEISTL